MVRVEKNIRISSNPNKTHDLYCSFLFHYNPDINSCQFKLLTKASRDAWNEKSFNNAVSQAVSLAEHVEISPKSSPAPGRSFNQVIQCIVPVEGSMTWISVHSSENTTIQSLAQEITLIFRPSSTIMRLLYITPATNSIET